MLEADLSAGSYGGTEWPPAPFRLLQAMVAGLRTINHPALRWFEAQPAPLILAQSEPPPVQFRRSVPNNANPSKQRSLTTLRDVIRRQVQQPVWYCYAIPAQTSAETIASALEAAYIVHTLGVGEHGALWKVACQSHDLNPRMASRFGNRRVLPPSSVRLEKSDSTCQSQAP